MPNNTKFGDACISEKHSNFFVNKGNATFDDMKNYNVEKIDQLQKYLGIVDLYDSKSVLQKALSKDSVTKVK